MSLQEPEPAVESFGLLLRQHRTEAGLTQEMLAERAGVSPRSVSGLERGEVQPHRNTAVRLLQALGLTPAQQARLLAAVQPVLRLRRASLDRAGEATAASLFAVTWSASAADRGADTAAGDLLPAALTSFIGRPREQAAIARLLQRTVRLLTLTGPGGVGKTRLALVVAEQLRRHIADGVLFVPLAPVNDAGRVLAAVAQVAGVAAPEPSALFAGLVSALRERTLLLVLDNFEHVIAAAPDLGALLAACPKLRVLVTSREALRIQGEQRVTVPPLELPDLHHLPPVAELRGIPAVALFVERAQAVQPDFDLTPANALAVAGICVRLDGLPLAIELAASWVRLFSPQDLLVRLQDSLSLLSDGARDLPARQRTLRATMEWSHWLLTAEEQALFRRLAVFTGGWTLEAAQEVAAAGDLPAEQVLELLARLVDTSLVTVEVALDGSVRYRLLDTLRRYAWDHLVAAGEVPQVRTRHLAWYLALTERAAGAGHGPDQASMLAQVAVEYANLAAAFAWAEEGRNAEAGLRLAVALGPVWHASGYTDEDRQRVEVLLALAEPATIGVDPLLRARGLCTAGMLALRRGDIERAGACYHDALALQRAAGDGTAAAQTLNHLGMLAYERGDFAAAAACHGEALVLQRACDDLPGVATSLGHLGIIAYNRREYGRAEALYEESLALHRRLGDVHGAGGAQEGLGHVACDTGDYARAGALYMESLACRQMVRERRGVAHSTSDLARVAAAIGDDVQAAGLYEESLAIFRSIGDQRGIAWVLTGLAAIASRQADGVRAERLIEESLRLHREIGNTLGAVDALLGAVFMAVGCGQLAGARQLWRESLGLCRHLDDPARAIRCLEGVAAMLATGTEPGRAARLFGAAAAHRRVLRTVLPLPDRMQLAARVRALRQRLGAAAFQQAWRAGAALSPAAALEEATAAALAP